MTEETKRQIIQAIEGLGKDTEVVVLEMDEKEGTLSVTNTGVDYGKLGYGCMIMSDKDGSGRAEMALQSFTEGMARGISTLEKKYRGSADREKGPGGNQKPKTELLVSIPIARKGILS